MCEPLDDQPQLLRTEKGYPSEIWWPSADSCVGNSMRHWQQEAKRLGFSPSGGNLTITVTLDKEHPYRMRTVVVLGEVENG